VTEFPEDEGKAAKPPTDREDDAGVKVKLPKLPLIGRIREFYHGVKMEMRKTSWPTRTEVWNTTVVVLIAVVFFGFYLWGVDRVVTFGFKYLDQWLGK
jgi:preprotein translocase subunit SecE